MSDYVNNDHQACFEGAFESFDMDFGQPTNAEAIDKIDWNQPSFEDLASVDWAAVHEEIMEEVFEDPAEGMQPGDRMPRRHFERTPRSQAGMQSHPVSPSGSQIKTFACHEPGCKVPPFKRSGDLNRHSRKHGSLQRFDCPASDCNRTGKRGFSRADKLIDHMLAGHSEDDWFLCEHCEASFIRAEYEVHSNHWMSHYRTCPMPRCSFKIHCGYTWRPKLGKLDLLLQHLLEKHDLQARSHFSELLRQRGYDARSCEVICPLCPSPCRFQKHGDFEDHFMLVHFQGPSCLYHEEDSCEATCWDCKAWRRIEKCTSFPDEVHQHRLAILRVWPLFADHPVWNDIKRCQPRT